MTEQASSPEPPVGWIVTVTTPRMGGGKPSIEIYYAAISDQIDAIDAVKAKSGAAQGTMVVAHQEISKSLTGALSLNPGDVTQW
jgi:esterase/lipase superfamily enzyme